MVVHYITHTHIHIHTITCVHFLQLPHHLPCHSIYNYMHATIPLRTKRSDEA